MCHEGCGMRDVDTAFCTKYTTYTYTYTSGGLISDLTAKPPKWHPPIE